MAWRDESGGDAFDVQIEDVLARPVNLCATGTTPGAALPVRLRSGPAVQVVRSPLPQWPYRFEVGVSPRSPMRHCRPRARSLAQFPHDVAQELAVVAARQFHAGVVQHAHHSVERGEHCQEVAAEAEG